MLPSSQQQVQKFISTNIINVFTSQVLSFLRAVLHRMGLQDLIAVPQANVTSALNRLALLSCVKHHLMLPCRLMSMTKGGHLTLAELLHVLPPPRAMLPWLQGSPKLLRLPSYKYLCSKSNCVISTPFRTHLGARLAVWSLITLPRTILAALFTITDSSHGKGSLQIQFLEKIGILSQPGRPPSPPRKLGHPKLRLGYSLY